jgi:hypothetical protein
MPRRETHLRALGLMGFAGAPFILRAANSEYSPQF